MLRKQTKIHGQTPVVFRRLLRFWSGLLLFGWSATLALVELTVNTFAPGSRGRWEIDEEGASAMVTTTGWPP
jgi:hypothetical protein